MGNICAGPTLGGNGFLQSVTAVVWRTREPDPLPPPDTNGGNSGETWTKKPDAKLPDPVKNQPPAPLQMVARVENHQNKPGVVKQDASTSFRNKNNENENRNNNASTSRSKNRNNDNDNSNNNGSMPRIKNKNYDNDNNNINASPSRSKNTKNGDGNSNNNGSTSMIKNKNNDNDNASPSRSKNKNNGNDNRNNNRSTSRIKNKNNDNDNSNNNASPSRSKNKNNGNDNSNINGSTPVIKNKNNDNDNSNNNASPSRSKNKNNGNEYSNNNASPSRINNKNNDNDNSNNNVSPSNAKPGGGPKQNKPGHRKTSSAGLQVESVLQRITGNIKDVYSLGKKLGQGQFGTTYLCVEKETGKEFACKSIAKRKLLNQEDVEDVRREIKIMHHLSGDPNVIQIIEAYEDAVSVHVVMDLCGGGELFDRIIKRGHYSERKAAELARVIVGVVQACHSLGVMHRDLKPENFLFVNEEEESPLKTIDFGLSMFFKPGETFTDVVGSPYYVAPEVLRKLYGPECDIWSAGVIIYILLCGVPPFWDELEQGIFQQVLMGELDFESEPWPTISESAKDLVRKMLVRDPKKRLTAHEVLCHPWVIVDGVAPDKPLGSAVLSRLKEFSAMNKLKKMAIRVIAETLSEEEIAGLKEMFRMIDVDNSGQITLEELKNGLRKAGTNLKHSEIVQLMKAADIDNSGTIDYHEFVAAMLNINKTQKEDHMFAAFSYFDKDGSGYITPDEIKQACEQFGLQDVHLGDIIREVDQDNDGRIDYGEFVAMMQDQTFGRKGQEK